MHYTCHNFAVRSRDRSRYGYKRLFPVAYRDSSIPYSLNISRVKFFADFAVLSWIVKILTSKNLF